MYSSLKLTLVIIIICVSFFVIDTSHSQENKLMTEISSKIKLVLDNIPVEIPSEMKQVSVTIKSQSLNTIEKKINKTAKISIFPTAFWNNIEDNMNDTSLLIHEIAASSLKKAKYFKGRVLNSITHQSLSNVKVTFYINKQINLVETHSDMNGFFQAHCFVNKEIKKMKVNFSLSEYKEKNTDILTDQSILGPIVLEPIAVPKNTIKIEKYNSIVVRLTDALYNVLSGLDVSLILQSKSKVTTKLKMLESNNLYSILVDKSSIDNCISCDIEIKDPKDVWSRVSKKIKCNNSKFFNIHLSLKGEKFASGSIKNIRTATAWLLHLDDSGLCSNVDVAPVDKNGNFHFTSKKGMEKNKYRIAVTLDSSQNTLPLWISPKKFKAALYGSSDNYSLGKDIQINIPKNYVDIFKYLKFIRYNNEIRTAKLVPNYNKETSSIIKKIDELLMKSNNKKAIAISEAESFEVYLSGEKEIKTTTFDNRFFENKWISFDDDKPSINPLVINLIPLGRQATLSEMKNIMKNTVNNIFNQTKNKANIMMLSDEWFSDNSTWQIKQNDFTALPVVVPQRSDFENKINALLFEKIEKIKGKFNTDSDLNLILLFDHAFLESCAKKTFKLKSKWQLGNVSICIFSESYMKGLSHFEGIIGLLKKAFKKSKTFKCNVMNPLDLQDLNTELNDILLQSRPRNYSWIPIKKGEG